MKTLFAPWRIHFIEDLRERTGGCVFCEVAAASPDLDEKNLVLYRGETAYVVMNKYPYISGHLLVIPCKHSGSLSDLSDEERSEIMKLSALSIDIISEALEADGFNCGFNLGRAAGAGIVDHVHLHVVPRWVGDNNFLPVLGDTRSIPEYLERTYQKLVGSFKKI
jgi:ATP adenylyltransferase